MKSFLRNLELWLSGAGLLVILAAPRVVGAEGAGLWRAAAITAAIVGVLHGVIFWLVRRRERRQREAAIRDVRAMMQHVVNNQLMVILGRISIAPATREDREGLAEATRAIEQISTLVNTLSDESVQHWKANDIGGQFHTARALPR